MSEPSTTAATTTATPAPVSAVEALYGAATAEKPEATTEAATTTGQETQESQIQETAVVATAGTGSEAETEEVEPTSLAELAEHLEVDPEWIKKLKVSDKVNGAPVEFSIEEALATHRKVAAADTYLADAKAKSKALIDEAGQHKETWATGIATVNELISTLESEIGREAKAVLTPALKESDPAMYAVRQNEIRERNERIAAIKHKAQQGIQQAVQKTVTEQSAALQQRLPQEREAFLARVPAWKDADAEKAELSKLAKYLQDDGWSLPEIKALAHHGRGLAQAYKAMLHDQGKDKLETIKKKVVKIPKILKPGPKPAAAKPNGAAKDDPVSILYGS